MKIRCKKCSLKINTNKYECRREDCIIDAVKVIRNFEKILDFTNLKEKHKAKKPQILSEFKKEKTYPTYGYSYPNYGNEFNNPWVEHDWPDARDTTDDDMIVTPMVKNPPIVISGPSIKEIDFIRDWKVKNKIGVKNGTGG